LKILTLSGNAGTDGTGLDAGRGLPSARSGEVRGVNANLTIARAGCSGFGDHRDSAIEYQCYLVP
jgi:hypothetical protein